MPEDVCPVTKIYETVQEKSPDRGAVELAGTPGVGKFILRGRGDSEN